MLADPETATDADYDAIEGVIAHEYFHNWSGNRITCRDWFQLSLKEGFTVLRDQLFSQDMGSDAVKRIEDVRVLRLAQFPEDSGPLAHSIRPDSYQEISNFYTSTVYNKGAEVIRMMRTMAGPERFRAGTGSLLFLPPGDASWRAKLWPTDIPDRLSLNCRRKTPKKAVGRVGFRVYQARQVGACLGLALRGGRHWGNWAHH